MAEKNLDIKFNSLPLFEVFIHIFFGVLKWVGGWRTYVHMSNSHSTYPIFFRTLFRYEFYVCIVIFIKIIKILLISLDFFSEMEMEIYFCCSLGSCYSPQFHFNFIFRKILTNLKFATRFFHKFELNLNFLHTNHQIFVWKKVLRHVKEFKLKKNLLIE